MTQPRQLTDVADAIRAVRADKLASVTYTATHVHVATVHGAGRFLRLEWLAADGPAESVRPSERSA